GPPDQPIEAEARKKHLEQVNEEHPDYKAEKHKAAKNRQALVPQSAKAEPATNNGARHTETGDHVTEVAAEEAVAVFALDGFCEIVASLGNRLAMRVADNGQAALPIYPIEDRPLARGKPGRHFLADCLQGQRAARVVEAQKPAHSERQGGGRECTPPVAAKTPVMDVVGKCRRDIWRRVEQWDDRTALGIASDHLPSDEIVGEHDKQAETGENPRPMVFKAIPQQLRLARRVNCAGRKLGHNGEPLSARKPPRSRNHQGARRVGRRPPVATALAQTTGKSRPTERPRSIDEFKVVVHREDREIPEIPGHVPI